MKLNLMRLLSLLAIVATPAAWATQYTATGAVSFLRVLDSKYYTTGNWIAVSGFTTAGSCPSASGRLVLMMKDDLRGQEMLRLAESARLANVPVTVVVDDTYTNSAGWCLIMNMSLSD